MNMGNRLGLVLYCLRRAGAETASVSTDRQLLERFLGQRDEAAFESLVQRHGPMVLGVCRRLLGDPADVDDAFQATFLVLIRCYWWYVNPEAEKKKRGIAGVAVGILVTFICVALTRIFFRAPDIQHAFAMFQQLSHFTWGLANVSRLVWITLGAGIFLYALPKNAYQGAVDLFTRAPVLADWPTASLQARVTSRIFSTLSPVGARRAA